MMISIVDLKQLIYRESGYKIQVQDNDPILAAFYVNLATLGEALKHAEQIQDGTRTIINSLPGVADQEMKRAGDAALKSLSTEVGRIAQKLAGDAATAEKARAISFAATWTTAGVIACAIVFGSVGFGIKMLADETNLNNARAKVVIAEKQAREDVEAVKKSIGWMGTEQGQLAKRFFASGGGDIAARCDSPVWEIANGTDGKYCIPKRRDLFGFGEDKDKYGWKIP